MDDTLVPMGYRGEDGSRAGAGSRRQPPWPSSGTGPDAHGRYDPYPDDDQYAGHDDYDEQAERGQYAGRDGGDGYSSGSYPAQPGGHASGGYPAQPGGHGSGGYPAQPASYRSGGYPAQPGGYGSGGYPAQAGEYGSGGYPAQPGGYGRSGGQPALPGGPGGPGAPGAPSAHGASGGFPAADAGAYDPDATTIDSYGTGPRPSAGRVVVPPGLVQTGDQELYDSRYPGYDSGDDVPYEAPHGDPRTAPHPAGDPRARRKKGTAKRRNRPLLLASLAAMVVIVGAAAYVLLHRTSPAGNTQASTGPLPSPGSTSAVTAACVKQLGTYCHIEDRTDDPAPLTLAELFPPAFMNQTDHGSFTRAGTKLDKTCSNAVIGQDLANALQGASCSQVLRASYVSGDNQIMGTIGVANLSTTNGAHHVGKVVGTNDFVEPLSTTSGLASKLGKGTGIVEAEFKGHYLIMIWAEFTSTKAPANSTQNQQLQQFGEDLIAGTANISLSQRMVSGHPATAAG